MENQEYPQTVQLEGEDLGRTRRMSEEVNASLRAMAEVVLDQVHGKSRAQGASLKAARIVFNNESFTFTQDGECGAWEDPLGICRPCTAEVAQHLQQ